MAAINDVGNDMSLHGSSLTMIWYMANANMINEITSLLPYKATSLSQSQQLDLHRVLLGEGPGGAGFGMLDNGVFSIFLKK